MLNYTDIEAVEKYYNQMPKYATIESLEEVLRPAVANKYPKQALAYEVLSGTLEERLEKYTTLPAFITLHLHRHRDRVVEQSELIEAAADEGFISHHVPKATRYWIPTKCHLGVWWDSKEEKEYSRWYPPNELTEWNQRLVDSGDDW